MNRIRKKTRAAGFVCNRRPVSPPPWPCVCLQCFLVNRNSRATADYRAMLMPVPEL